LGEEGKMKALYNNLRLRYLFGKIGYPVEPSYFLDFQRESYRKFLQMDVPPEQRDKGVGIERVFREVFPIVASNGLAELRYKSYTITPPPFSPEECIEKGISYAGTLKVNLELFIYEENESGKVLREVRELKDVYVGEIPIMTETGHFIINGSQKVIVNQLHRSPGVFFEVDKTKLKSTGRHYFMARIIPYHGSWMDFEFDNKDRIVVKIEKKKKISATTLLKAFGYSEEEILKGMYPIEKVFMENGRIYKAINPDVLKYQVSSVDIRDAEGRTILEKGKRFGEEVVKALIENKIERLPIDEESLYGKILASDIKHPKTGEVLFRVLDEITPAMIEDFRKLKINEFEIVYYDNMYIHGCIVDTLRSDSARTKEEAIDEIFGKLKPNEHVALEEKERFINNAFFNPEFYDLSYIGRHKINMALDRDVPIETRCLTREDLFLIVKKLFWLRNQRGQFDDIDHLGNRRVRAGSELVEMYFLSGMKKVARITSERLSTLQMSSILKPGEIINFKPAISVVKDFFNTNSLCQFMEQVNPLSEMTHKRRLSALGPGGLTRERAGYEVRDVHPSHYGKICPIETPEGQNIGIITSLATYARVDRFGYLQTPYRKVKEGKPTWEIVYLNALEEEKYTIVPADTPLDENGYIKDKIVVARKGGEIVKVSREKVELMDVVPAQLVGVSASLIPFLEHDDANRALMGSNMQRQAVPLIQTEAPLVGTGLEWKVAVDSGYAIKADYSGIIEYVDGTKIVLRVKDEDYPEEEDKIKIYTLKKYQRSNQKTCINQKPVVKKGDFVKRGQVIADGPAINKGELALGRNVLVGFLSWGGYNYEDSILISERLVRDDVYTSIYIEEYECEARETKLGSEEITRDVPGVPEEALANLDEEGIIRIGARVKPGDILVGKVTPKGETILSPEEKLLKAIFGDKAGDFKDSSLRASPGTEGVVIDVKVFVRKGAGGKEQSKVIKRLLDEKVEEIEFVKKSIFEKVKSLLVGKTVTSNFTHQRKVLLKKGTVLKEEALQKIHYSLWKKLAEHLSGEPVVDQIEKLVEKLEAQIALIETIYKEKINAVRKGDELPVGVNKKVKVTIASLRKIQVGDKMAGRHGNKGVISKVLPVEDMPFLPDGTPLDIVLNPLGVPSRMNIGQILETLLGWACKELGAKISSMIDGVNDPNRWRKVLKEIYDSPNISKLIDSLTDEELRRVVEDLKNGVYVASPVFDGAKEEEIKALLKKAGLPETGTVQLRDGRTGEPFDQKATVGYMYMLKLEHMVEDKIYARSTGPYSLITQQPLGGKAQRGGQRLGEMEVWALEAYGAANLLQEFLTVKSDDVRGRREIFESIKKGKYELKPGLPESFHVLVKELQALCLDVELLEDEEESEEEEEFVEELKKIKK
jgi:DNA-directed RNA polymerase subunit beta